MILEMSLKTPGRPQTEQLKQEGTAYLAGATIK